MYLRKAPWTLSAKLRRTGIWSFSVPAVLANDAGGVGLFRSEFLYLNCDDYPTEDQQFEAYKKALSDMQGPVSRLRTFLISLKAQPHMHITKYQISVIAPELHENGFRVKSF